MTGDLLFPTFIDLLFLPFFFVLVSQMFGRKKQERAALPATNDKAETPSV
ncbi:MAG: hypothetical protein PHI97_31110 [Desulfobulbus sp.]|nr:hypothetical protein [Desulfobulbus sp.]